MALVNCRSCGAAVSTEAAVCPRCGAPCPAVPEWTGTGFEWKSSATILGLPLIHVAFGRDARGKIKVAKGVIAVGQFAVGLIAVAQFGLGLFFGFGQFILGSFAVAQFALAAVFGVGQVATGYAAVGQVVFAGYGLAQLGIAQYLWSPGVKDAEAARFFVELYNTARWLFGK